MPGRIHEVRCLIVVEQRGVSNAERKSSGEETAAGGGRGVIIYCDNNNRVAVSEFDITGSRRCRTLYLHDALFGVNSMQR